MHVQSVGKEKRWKKKTCLLWRFYLMTMFNRLGCNPHQSSTPIAGGERKGLTIKISNLWQQKWFRNHWTINTKTTFFMCLGHFHNFIRNMCVFLGGFLFQIPLVTLGSQNEWFIVGSAPTKLKDLDSMRPPMRSSHLPITVHGKIDVVYRKVSFTVMWESIYIYTYTYV